MAAPIGKIPGWLKNGSNTPDAKILTVWSNRTALPAHVVVIGVNRASEMN